MCVLRDPFVVMNGRHSLVLDKILYLCVYFHYAVSTLCMYVMYLTSLTDPFDDRTGSMPF